MIGLTILAVAAAAQPAAAPRVVLIAPAKGPALLKQCSRPSPKAGSFFNVTPTQVERLEREVVREMKVPPAIRTRWRVEAVGIAHADGRFVYGSFMPAQVPATKGVPTVVCDGGPVFFGAEMDAATGRIVGLRTNGR